MDESKLLGFFLNKGKTCSVSNTSNWWPWIKMKEVRCQIQLHEVRNNKGRNN